MLMGDLQLEVQGISATVIGVMEAKGRSAGEDSDKSILSPITTIQKRFIGVDVVGMAWAQPRDSKLVDQTMDQIWECLMRRHGNAPGQI